MVKRKAGPGTSPVSALAPGSAWLDERPTFAVGDPLLMDVLQQVHGNARLLARRRAELGLSQTQVASWSGVTRQTVAALEDGTTWPDHLTLARVGAVVGITVRAAVTPGTPIGPRRPSLLYRGS